MNRFLWVRGDESGLILTVWNHGILLCRTKQMNRPLYWWTKRFSVSLFGWTLRLCCLIPQERIKWVYDWAELDRVVLKATRFRLQAWNDLAICDGLSNLFRDDPMAEVLFELGEGT